MAKAKSIKPATTLGHVIKSVPPASLKGSTVPISQNEFHISQDMYKTIVERSADAVLLLGDDGTVKYAAPNIVDLIGYKPSHIIGTNVLSLIHPDDIAQAQLDLGNLIVKPNNVADSMVRFKHKNGAWVWVEAIGTNLLQDPSVNAIVANLRDATERKRTENSLGYQTALLQAQNEATRDGILVSDTKGNVLFHNKQFTKMWKTPDNIMDTKDDNLALEFAMTRLVDPVGFRDRVDYLYAHPNEVSHELIYFKDGQILDRYGSPVVDDSGKIYGWAWYFRDVTEDKRAEQAMQTQNEYLVALQETAVALTSRLDVTPLLNTIIEHAARIANTENGYIYLVNDESTALSVRIGTGVFKKYLGHTIAKGEGIAGKVWQTGKAIVVDDYDTWEGRSPTFPKSVFHSIVCIPLKSNRKVIGAIALAHPYIERKFTQQEIVILKRLAELASIALDNAYLYERARTEANERKVAEALSESLAEQQARMVEINRSKDEFITLASHQLRTPATGVKQYIGMVLDGYAGDLTGDQRDLLGDAYESNERQLGIVNDLLQVAHLDTGHVSLQRRRIDIIDMITDVIDEQADTFKGRQQGVRFRHDINELMLNVDRDRLRMVLENLIDNASKYSLKGKTLTISVVKTKTDAEIEIQDQGVGIRKKDIDKLFKKFSRIDNPLSTLVGGTGLGLYWAKQVIDLHGGSITVSSKLNKGTTFCLTLPLL